MASVARNIAGYRIDSYREEKSGDPVTQFLEQLKQASKGVRPAFIITDSG